MLYQLLFILVTLFHAVVAVPMLKPPDESVDEKSLPKSFALLTDARALKLSQLKKLVQELAIDDYNDLAKQLGPDGCDRVGNIAREC